MAGSAFTGTDDTSAPLRVRYWNVFRSSRACAGGLRGESRVRRRGSGFAISSTGWPGRRPLARGTFVSLRGTIETEGLRALQARATLSEAKSRSGGSVSGWRTSAERRPSPMDPHRRGCRPGSGTPAVREGTLRMGIAGGDAPFHAELPATADLGSCSRFSASWSGQAFGGDRPDPTGVRAPRPGA